MDRQIELNTLRKARGLPQKDLAKILNVSNSTIALYETGKRKPTLDRAIKIAEFFNVPVEKIKFGSNEGNKNELG